MTWTSIKQKTGVCPECLTASQGDGSEPFEVPLFAGLCQYHKRLERASVYADRKTRKEVEIKPVKIQERSRKHDEKSIPELIKLATIVFNKWIRIRDSKRGFFICISCNQKKDLKDLQAGHFIPSTFASTRFNPLNVNGECISCNCHDPEHLVGYRRNLEEKLGTGVIEVLEEISRRPHKWEREELLGIIKAYKL